MFQDVDDCGSNRLHGRYRNGVGGSVSIPSLIMDAVSITVDLSPVAGERMKLLLMGSGGEIQQIAKGVSGQTFGPSKQISLGKK